MSGHIVLASNKKGLIPSTIRWMTNSKFNHSFVMMPEILNTPICIEAESTGVNIGCFNSGYKNDLSEGYQIWEIKIDQNIKDSALKSILNDLQISYGYLQFIWFVWRKILSLVGKDIKDQNNWIDEGMICSQLCVAYLDACGLQSTMSGYGKGSIAPGDLYKIFSSYPEIFKMVEQVRIVT